MKRPVVATCLALILTTLTLVSCAAVKELAALSQVRFRLDKISSMRVAGVDVMKVRKYDDLGILDIARLTAAVAAQQVPLTFTVNMIAENPASNTITARLIGLDWKLFLQNKEALSGAVTNEVVLEPGKPQSVPVSVSLDLVKFYKGGLQDMINLALSLAVTGGTPQNIHFEARPTIRTPIGPMRFPKPINISATVGG